MSSSPLVSIIIPVYNGADYVGEAIGSALRQTYRNTEILVVDDGSTDHGATRRVAESFGQRVRYIPKPNGGVATALNTGIEHMRGELFSWLSHDDLYRRNKVERQVEVWQRFGQPCVVIGDFETMDETGKSLGRIDLSGYNLVARPLDAVFRGLINGCTLLIPRELFHLAGLFEPGLPTTQDYHLWYRMARLVPFVHCPFADVRQRLHAAQGSRHSAHLDEASRMFTHLIGSTPVALMEAYDGSELRFLLRVRQVLGVYEGLRAALDARIAPLMRKLRYSLVLDAQGCDPQPALDAIKHWELPPHDTVAVIHPGGFHPAHCPARMAYSKSQQPEDVLSCSTGILQGDPVIFVKSGNLPSLAGIRRALETLLTEDADLVARTSAAALSDLDFLVARRDGLGSLRLAMNHPEFDLSGPVPGLRVFHLPQEQTSLVPSDETVQSALRGEIRLHYTASLSAAGIGKLLNGLLDPELPVILFILHSLGGGAHTLVKSLMKALRGKAGALICYGHPNGDFYLSAGSERMDTGVVFRPEDMAGLIRTLRRARVARVDVHHSLGFEKQVERLIRNLGVPFDVTAVDYHLVARNPFLCNDQGCFVGDDNLLPLLRPVPLPLLRKASRVIAISRDQAARLTRLYPEKPIIAARLWHEYGVPVRHVFPPPVRQGEPLRIAICGDIAAHKGRQTVIDTVVIAASRALPLEFHVLGDLDAGLTGVNLANSSLIRHGKYQPGEFTRLLSSISPHAGWIPSQAPETWSYVLTDLMHAGLPVVATSVGAISERVYGRPYTWLLPWTATPQDWIELFLRLHASSLAEPPQWLDVRDLPPLQDFYFTEYLRPLAPPADSGKAPTVSAAI